MVEKPTIGQNFLSGQELNTQVLQQDNLPQQMLQANAQRWQMMQVEYAKQQKELEQILTTTNFDKTGIWDVDLDEINKDISEFIEYVKKNPKNVIPKANNLEGYYEMQQKKNDILYKIGKSKADKIIYENQQKFLQNPNNIDWNTQNNQDILNNFYNKDNYKDGLISRKWSGFAPPDLYDETKVIDWGRKNMKPTSINSTTDITPSSEVKSTIGIIASTPSIRNQQLYSYKSRLDGMVKKDPNMEIDIYTDEDLEKADKTGKLIPSGKVKVSELTPEQYADSEMRRKLWYKNIDIKQYAPQSSSSSSGSGADRYKLKSQEDIDTMYAIMKGTIERDPSQTKTKKGRKISFYKYGSGELEVYINGEKDRLDGIIKDENTGNLYYALRSKRTDEGGYTFSERDRIHNFWQDVLKNSLTKNYAGLPTLMDEVSKVQLYAYETDPVLAKKLGIPPPSNMGNDNLIPSDLMNKWNEKITKQKGN